MGLGVPQHLEIAHVRFANLTAPGGEGGSGAERSCPPPHLDVRQQFWDRPQEWVPSSQPSPLQVLSLEAKSSAFWGPREGEAGL